MAEEDRAPISPRDSSTDPFTISQDRRGTVLTTHGAPTVRDGDSMTPNTEDDDQGGVFLQVQRRATDKAVVLHVTGELDLITAPRFTEELTAARPLATPSGTLVVDLTDVSFMASVGLGALVEHHQLCHAGHVALRVVAGNRTVHRAITLTGLHDILTVFTTLDEALDPSLPHTQ